MGESIIVWVLVAVEVAAVVALFAVVRKQYGRRQR